MDKDKIGIVVPCFNESQRLDSTAFLKFTGEHPHIHFIFVDDGSTDNTPALLRKLHEQSPMQFHILTLDKNAGKAIAVRTGVLSAIDSDYIYVGYWDADLSAPLTEIPRLMQALSNKSLDIAIGSRVKILGYNIQRQLHRHLAGRVFATIASNTLTLSVYDTQCGAKLFRNNHKLRRAFENPLISNWAFDVEILQRYLLMNVGSLPSLPKDTIEEVPLKAWKDTGGSKVKPWDFFIALFELFKIYRHYRHPATQQCYKKGIGR